ncbi:MAG TPA: hypothetical protein VHH32_09255 [Gemmatimonadales bacterium]|nr:hypothetical protein [Gemmatimonadales bacterium]
MALLLLVIPGLACGGDDLECTGPLCVIIPKVPQPSNLLPIQDNPTVGAPGRALSDSIGVLVTDSMNRPVSGVRVDFEVSSGGGRLLSSRSATSDIRGYARVAWELGPEVGAQELEAVAMDSSDAHLNGSPLTLSVNAQQPAPAKLVLRRPPSQDAQSGVRLEIQPGLDVLDSEDQPVPNVEVVAAVVSGGGRLLGTTTVASNQAGQAEFTDLAVVGAQGGHELHFSVPAVPGLELTSLPIQLSAGTPETLTGVDPLTYEGTVNSAVTPGPSVVVRDAAGNGIPGVSVLFSSNRNASVSPETAITNGQGVAQVSWTLGTTANVQYTLTARVEGSSIPSVRFSAMARPGAAGRLSVEVQPSSPTQSGTAFAQQPVIQVVDQQGNPAPQSGITVTAAISSGPTGSLANATATTNSAGQAAFSGLTLIGEVGSYTLSFGAPGLAGVTSAPFAITTGSAARLTLTTPPSTMARSRAAIVQQPVVQIQDASGNPIRQAGTVVRVTVSPTSTSVTNETATTDENGRAAFSGLTLTGIPGHKDLTFSADGLQSVTATVTLPSVQTVFAAPSHPVSATVGTTVAGPVITWRFEDAATRPVADADFTLTVPSGGTALPLAPFSDINGAVQVGDWTLGPAAGYQYLELRLPGGRVFKDSILATPDVPADLVLDSGDNQTAPVSSTLPNPLVVRVVDQYGNGVPNVPVQWATCDGVPGPLLSTDGTGYSTVTQPTGSEPTDGCTRASITQPADSVDFHYQVTEAASQGEQPEGISGAQSRHGGPPPIAPQSSRPEPRR